MRSGDVKVSGLGQFGRCFACERWTLVYNIGAMGPQFEACDVCIGKHGARFLREGADRCLAEAVAKHGDPGCRHCGGPLVQLPNLSWPLWCHECEGERQFLTKGRPLKILTKKEAEVLASASKPPKEPIS